MSKNSLEELNKILSAQPPFRLKQARSFVFKELGDSWTDAKILPAELRQKLDREFPLLIKAQVFESRKSAGVKILLTLSDGLKIESVLMRHQDGRNTVCVSSQAGCPLGCLFCATGQIGFKRNLTAWEIVQQVLFFARLLKKENQRVSNVVFMGMGEPFLNYDNVFKAIEILNDKNGLNIGARHISISTVGIIEGLEKLSRETLQVNLAISLHAPNDNLRSQIMPVNRKYPLTKIIEAVDRYMEKTKRKVMLEYILLKDVNDSVANAQELAALIKKPLYVINLIFYNQTAAFESSPGKKIKKFKEVLQKAGLEVSQRYRFGEDIKAACGQLAGEKQVD